MARRRQGQEVAVQDFEVLAGRVRHGDEHEQAAAAQALGASGDPRALPLLLQLLDAASDPARDAAALGLSDLGDSRAVPALARHIVRPRNPRNIGTLIYALESLDARAALVALAQAMGEGNYEVLAMSLRVIEAFTGPPAPADVVRALDILRGHLARRGYEDWQREMLGAAIESLEIFAPPG
jgi:HEAT repeat protein